METVVIVIHLMVIVAMIAMVLLQRSEGGALGIGGGGGGGMMSARGQGNVLTRSTGILAAAFFATSIGLTVLSRLNEPASAILDVVPIAESTEDGAVGGSGEGILDALEGMSQPSDAPPLTTDDGTTFHTPPSDPQVPSSQ